jgi:hypothetical protein
MRCCQESQWAGLAPQQVKVVLQIGQLASFAQDLLPAGLAFV